MKKPLALLAAIALVGALAVPAVAVAAPGDNAGAHCRAAFSKVAYNVAAVQGNATATIRGYVDADGNGICDRYEARANGSGGYADGVCPGCGLGYVDADGDGVCDNYHGQPGGGYGYGGGNGYGAGNGTGICPGCGLGFTDADGDGVCDHYNGQQPGGGTGGGGGYGNGTGNGTGYGHHGNGGGHHGGRR